MTATTSTEAPERPGGRTDFGARSGARSASWSATRALARTEAVRLLRHSAVLVAFALYAAQWAYSAYSGNDRYPVLQDEDRFTQLPLLIPAAGTLLAANLAALRPHRHGTDAMLDLLVLPPWRRTCAQLLSLLPLTALSAVLVGARIGYAAVQEAAVGSPSGAELATGPLVVLLAGAIGVLAARFVRSVAAGPLTLAGLGIVTVAGALPSRSDWRWWGLVAVEDENRAPLPSSLMHRPAGWHLLYLAALLALVAAAALLRSGRRVTTGLAVATGLVPALAVLAGSVQLLGVADEVSRARAVAERAPSPQQVCGSRGPVDYCAFPEFADRSEQWAQVAEGILRWAPQVARERRYVVRQHIVPATSVSGLVSPLPLESWAADDRAAGTPGALPVGTDWGTHSDVVGDRMLAFAGSLAHRAVVGESSPVPEHGVVCRSRGVLTLWLAVRSTADTRDAYDSLSGRSWGGITLNSFDAATGLGFNRREQDVVDALLKRSVTETGARVKKFWAELTAPDTTTDRAAALLGVRVPPPATRDDEGVCAA
ncbi:ABC transporter permease [Streptomyces sp. NPDC051020]|uniref:ABC transporter permease n=1 Tax=Streptomyces sp. NPDC051020 TaxID=3155409 RepID=UPI003441DD36